MVIFLAFANDEENFLEELVKEEQAIRNELFKLEKEGSLHLKVSPRVNIDDLFDVFRSYHNEIRIFHFGGHADQKKLQFDKEFAQKEGLARLISIQKNLRLVFLNGCSTKGHVEQLLELGVKVVVATSAPIHDLTAYNFAKEFYSCIARNHTISESFDSAVAKLEIRKKIDPGSIRKHAIDSRGFELSEEIGSNPWGLFFKKENHSTLDWKIAPKLISSTSIKPKLPIGTRRSYEALAIFIDHKVENQLKESYSQSQKIELLLTDVSVSNSNSTYDIKDIERIFNEKGKMLIIGEPGAGKSNIALQIAKKSIDDIKALDNSTRPIPVLLNLATWAIRKKSIEDWIASELSLKSNGPLSKRNAKKLVKERLILPFLDGLDQVPDPKECFDFILQFIGDYTNLPIFLTCRNDTYYQHKEQLNKFQVIFQVNNLNKNDIDEYLKRNHNPEISAPFSYRNKALRDVLNPHEFYDLLSTPLRLRISLSIDDLPTIINNSNSREIKEKFYRLYFDSTINQKKEDGIVYDNQDRKKLLNWFSWLAKNVKNNQFPAEYFSSNNLRPGWLLNRGKGQVFIYFLVSRILQAYVLFFCFTLKTISISGYEFILAGLFSGVLVAVIDYSRLKRRIAKRTVSPIFQIGIFLIIFSVCGFLLSLLFGYFRESPADEKVYGIFSTNGINMGFLCSLLISGIFGWRGWLQEVKFKDILPETNFDFNPKSALKGALSYGVGFGIFLIFVVIVVLNYGSDAATRWLLKAADIYVSPYTATIGIGSSIFDVILLGVVAGLIYGGAFGFLLSGQQGDPVAPGSKRPNLNRNFWSIYWMKNLLTHPLFIYSVFCVSFFFILIISLHSNASFNDIIINSTLFGITFSIMLIIWQKGFDLIQAVTLRFFLYNHGFLPSLRYTDFLEYGIKLSFLKRKGSEYEFFHNEIRDYLSIYESDENLNSSLEKNWNKSINIFLVTIGVLFLAITSFSLLSPEIESKLFPTNTMINGYERFTLRVGDNIENPYGILFDSIEVTKGDTLIIDAWGYIHPGDFLKWTAPEGTKIGLFGFPLFGAYDVDNLDQETPLARLLWQVSGEKFWQPYEKGKKLVIKENGNLVLNLNGRHYQKFKGKFFVSIFLKGME